MPRRSSARLGPLGPAVLQAAKTAAAAGISWFIAANMVGNNIPVFAPLAALLTVQVTVWESVSRGMQRVLGVVVGVLVAYAFARLAGINAWSIALIVFAALLAGRVLRLGQQGSIQVPISALLVLVLGATTGGYAVDRVVDTAIGAGVGILVNLVVVPPTHLDEARGEVRAFAGALAGLLRDVAGSLALPGGTPTAHLERARQLSAEAEAAASGVKRTEAAIRWSPAGRRDRPTVEKLQGVVKALSMVERPARGIARAFTDAPEGRCLPDAVAGPLGQLLRSVADELEVWSAQATSAGTGPAVAAGATGANLYHEVIIAVRAPEITPEMAAVASAIALDAQRISDEIHRAPWHPPTRPAKWRTVFRS